MPKKPRIGSRAWAGHIQLNSQAGELVDPSTWRQVDEDALSEERRELFLRRKKAVLDYFDGASAKEIKQRWGMGRSQVYRLISERCLKTAHDGHLFGWRGLIPHMRITPWTRQTTPEIMVLRRFVWNLTARSHRRGARWGLWATRQSELSTNPPGGAFC